MEHMVTFIFVLMTAGLLLVGGVIFAVFKLFSRPSSQGTEDEARMIQEMYQGLVRMEERIEALETILLEKDSKERRS